MGWITGCVLAVIALHLLATWAESRGWVYYRERRGGSVGTAMGNALSEFEAILNPGVEHTIEFEHDEGSPGRETGETD